MSTDRIEKTVVVRAPRSRVWRALADAQEFGAWFGVRFRGAFAEGARLLGEITVPGHEHLVMEVEVVCLDEERLFSWRWHPDAVDPGVDYSAEPTTLVEFRLEDAPGGTRVTVTESGFDAIPVARRAKAVRDNDRGWTQQVENLSRHVSS